MPPVTGSPIELPKQKEVKLNIELVNSNYYSSSWGFWEAGKFKTEKLVEAKVFEHGFANR